MAEGNAGTTTFQFTVTSTQPAPESGISFDVSTADGTATSPGDYSGYQNLTLTFDPGATTVNVFVNVNGDTTPEPNETFFVNITNPGGATITDGQGQGTIQNDDIVITPIHDIQGNGKASPIVGQSVTTTGIVTGRKTNGYFIQDPNVDADPNTSEAMFVFTSSAPSAAITVGDSVRVAGTVAEFISATSDEPVTPSDPKTATELTSPTTTILSSGNPLPAPLTEAIFTSAAPSRSGELEKYEYMRVSVSSLTVTQPTNNNFGEFWGVTTGTQRPFREPGIESGDPIPAADQGPFNGSAPPNVRRQLRAHHGRQRRRHQHVEHAPLGALRHDGRGHHGDSRAARLQLRRLPHRPRLQRFDQRHARHRGGHPRADADRLGVHHQPREP
jgi:predicted extracellular nuclease